MGSTHPINIHPRLDTPADDGSVNSEVVWKANGTYSTELYADRAAQV